VDFLNKLPISLHFEKIREFWNEELNFAIKSPTGSGKSLGLPLFFWKQKLVAGKILVVQPRRIAAKSLARIACKFCKCELGEEIGYRVRFDSRVSAKTKIIYLTDGMIFRFLQNPVNLKEVDLIIFDEFHERSLFMDASLALAKSYHDCGKINSRIVVTSATLELEKISNFLGAKFGLEVNTKSFPVEILHKAINSKQNLPAQVCDNLKVLLSRYEGDVLIFMDGAAQIKRTIREIENRIGTKNLQIFALFGEMSQETQDYALSPSQKRKIIVSTNLAETSLTIEGIKIVIDTGIAKKNRFDPYRKVNVLLPEPISKSSASQRAGRAGRLSAGFCLRMWSENEHVHRKEFEEAEVHRLDLSEIYLNLASTDCSPHEMDWYEPPAELRLKEAEKFLISIGALNAEGALVPVGYQLAQLPVHPRIGFALLLAKEKNCLSGFSLICALMDFKNPIDFGRRTDFSDARKTTTSDLLIFLKAYQTGSENHFSGSTCKPLGIHGLRLREIENTARLLCESLGGQFSCPRISYEDVVEILLKVYPERLAYLENKGTNSYRDSSGLSLQLFKESAVSGSQWVLPLRVLEKKKQGRIVLEMDEVTEIKEPEIRKFLDDRIISKKDAYLDTSTHQVFVRTVEMLGEVVVSKKESVEVNESQRIEAYANAIIHGTLVLKKWDQGVENFLSRVNFLAAFSSDYGIVPFDEDAKKVIIKEICSSKAKWKEIRNANVLEFVHAYYGKEKLMFIEQAAPAKYLLDGWSKPTPLRYENTKVYLQAPIQKLYDMKMQPSVVFGKCLVLLELLAPNGRIIQCTDDILGFWDRSYPSIKKELAGRYPKHEWR
jgi:ATP-dependent helicase HrpB